MQLSTNEDNLDQHVMPMSEGISGDAQLTRRVKKFTLNLWAADEQSEALVAPILRNTPLLQSWIWKRHSH
jgi:hypothetical protein